MKHRGAAASLTKLRYMSKVGAVMANAFHLGSVLPIRFARIVLKKSTCSMHSKCGDGAHNQTRSMSAAANNSLGTQYQIAKIIRVQNHIHIVILRLTT